MKLNKRSITASIFIVASAYTVCAQENHVPAVEILNEILDVKPKFDSSYIKSYKYELTGRLYVSQKYTSFYIPSNDGSKHLTFIPNNTFNTGIGFTYRTFTLNLGFGLPGINGNSSQRGKTNSLDCQMHSYGRKGIFDVYFQLYKGYYLNEGSIPDYNGFFSNSQLRAHIIGGSYTHIHNNRKFTLRPGAVQDEKQLKSAGSLLYGFEFVYSKLQNDSDAFVSLGLQDYSNYLHVRNLKSYNLGPTVGYGYNLIFLKDFFLSAAVQVTVSASHNTTKIVEDESIHLKTKWSCSPNATGRASVGYMKDNWSVSVYFVNQTTTSRDGFGNSYAMNTGNFRMNFVKRFTPGKKVAKLLKPVDRYFK